MERSRRKQRNKEERDLFQKEKEVLFPSKNKIVQIKDLKAFHKTPESFIIARYKLTLGFKA